jgi:hypothetical protein
LVVKRGWNSLSKKREVFMWTQYAKSAILKAWPNKELENMLRSFFWNRKRITERLLAKREQAGDNEEKHRRYHQLVSRYQKIVLRHYLARQLKTRM